MPERREGAPTAGYLGLTDQEAVVLRALVELGEAPAAVVARRAGLLDDVVLAALGRIVHLHYAVMLQEGAATIYRGVAQAGR
jgi:hypothetical protein